jgi:hypothetical protein
MADTAPLSGNASLAGKASPAGAPLAGNTSPAGASLAGNASPAGASLAGNASLAGDAPGVVTRYLRAADARDADACAECFTEDGTVLDEGVTYRGREEIRRWRETVANQWTYTATVTDSRPVTADEHRVAVRLVGDFPGGQVDLAFGFLLRDGLIAALKIVE